MTLVIDKGTHCSECKKKFTKELPFWAQHKCNTCYQRLYRQGQMLKARKSKATHCSSCNGEFDKLNERGKPIRRASRGMCKRCYHKEGKPSKVCVMCGNIMLTKARSGLCAVCKLDNSTVRTKKKRIKPLPLVEREQFELIRRLLARYKVGHNDLVDNFRVADIYMDINDNPILLDTLSEASQVVEMLRNLKLVFDHNLPFSKKKNMGKKIEKGTYANEWYNKNKQRLKAKRLLK